jgi:hypothetical protein
MKITPRLDLKRCPHCNIANPNIVTVSQFNSKNANSNCRIQIAECKMQNSN